MTPSGPQRRPNTQPTRKPPSEASRVVGATLANTTARSLGAERCIRRINSYAPNSEKFTSNLAMRLRFARLSSRTHPSSNRDALHPLNRCRQVCSGLRPAQGPRSRPRSGDPEGVVLDPATSQSFNLCKGLWGGPAFGGRLAAVMAGSCAFRSLSFRPERSGEPGPRHAPAIVAVPDRPLARPSGMTNPFDEPSPPTPPSSPRTPRTPPENPSAWAVRLSSAEPSRRS